jgi:outer membrane protein
MKRTVLAGIAALVAATAVAQTASPAASTPPRIAVIDVERLVRDSALGKEAFARLKKINDAKKDDADKLAKELREMEQKLADQGQSLAEDKREALQKQYQERAIAFKRFNDDAKRELDQAQTKELAELEKRVLPIITQVGKERGYQLIFNKFNAGLLFADDTADVTEDVLKRFNTTVAVPQAAKGSPPPATAPAPKPTPAPKKN